MRWISLISFSARAVNCRQAICEGAVELTRGRPREIVRCAQDDPNGVGVEEVSRSGFFQSPLFKRDK
jgi:hypothetical protein